VTENLKSKIFQVVNKTEVTQKVETAKCQGKRGEMQMHCTARSASFHGELG
jgi:hypothetical protein